MSLNNVKLQTNDFSHETRPHRCGQSDAQDSPPRWPHRYRGSCFDIFILLGDYLIARCVEVFEPSATLGNVRETITVVHAVKGKYVLR